MMFFKRFIISMIFFMSMTILPSFADDEEMNIVYVTDNNYVLYTLLSIKSIFDNNTSNSKFRFFIIENGISKHNRAKISNYIEKNNQKAEFIKCDTTPIDGGENMQTGLIHERNIYITRIVAAKLLIPELLPEDIEKALYLDSDTLVLSDIKELYSQDISNYIIGMGMDNVYYNSTIENEIPIPIYYNSGILLINVKKWKEDNINAKILDYVKKNPKIRWPDQDVLNKILPPDEIKMLDRKWNNQYRTFNDTTIETTDNGGIIHYFTKVKPWQFGPHDSQFKRKYLAFWAKSPFALSIIPHFIKAIYKHYTEFLIADSIYWFTGENNIYE